MITIKNPVLTGFHPDPSMIRVGEDYYIAVSTFEWFPGVEIYHSKNLRDWELAVRPLNRLSQLNMTGEASSKGVWAPCLSYHNGKFYLIYSDMKSTGVFYDVNNYLVTAEDIQGPWSEPIYMNSSGFDPSLFHDDDGRKWFVNMFSDFRTWKVRFSGIVLQEYSEEEQRLIGEPMRIFAGTPARTTEGPHLYKRDGWYYLFCAEGGTGVRHQETVLRSRNVEGPYEVSPYTPLITGWPYADNPIQKAGHASLVEGNNGEWYLAHLCGRPVEGKYCILGRETAIQKVVWENDWPRLAGGSSKPQTEVEVNYPDTDDETRQKGAGYFGDWRDDFSGSTWDAHFQTLRVPMGDKASMTARPGWLRMYGRESLESCYDQSFLGFRQQHFCVQADTKAEFAPVSHQQMAGLTYFYNGSCFYYLYVTHDEELGRVLTVMRKLPEGFDMPTGAGIPLPEEGPVWMRMMVRYGDAQFYYSLDGEKYEKIGPQLDARRMSDEEGPGRFTGAFFGICCQDISGRRRAADFDFVEYRVLTDTAQTE